MDLMSGVLYLYLISWFLILDSYNLKFTIHLRTNLPLPKVQSVICYLKYKVYIFHSFPLSKQFLIFVKNKICP